MSCAPCEAAFAVTQDKVAAFNNASAETCGCEKCSVSVYSPGIVGDEETLHFLVYTPKGRQENGTLNPALLMQADRNGVSVLRDGAADAEFEVTMSELSPRWVETGRELEGIITFRCDAVRYHSNERFCCVYDTGLELKPYHADLMLPAITAESNNKLKQKQMSRLKQLVDAIGNNFSDVTSFRQGRLSHLNTSTNDDGDGASSTL